MTFQISFCGGKIEQGEKTLSRHSLGGFNELLWVKQSELTVPGRRIRGQESSLGLSSPLVDMKLSLDSHVNTWAANEEFGASKLQ